MSEELEGEEYHKTEQYQNEKIQDELKPLEVIVKEKEEKNPTSEDTIDIYTQKVTEEEIKEMQDAQ